MNELYININLLSTLINRYKLLLSIDMMLFLILMPVIWNIMLTKRLKKKIKKVTMKRK